jgi:hypothetical protein
VIYDQPDGRERVAKTQVWIKKINEEIAARQAGAKAEEAAA